MFAESCLLCVCEGVGASVCLSACVCADASALWPSDPGPRKDDERPHGDGLWPAADQALATAGRLLRGAPPLHQLGLSDRVGLPTTWGDKREGKLHPRILLLPVLDGAY